MPTIIGKGIIITNQEGTQYYTSSTNFPLTGKTNTLYVDKSTGAVYVWDGDEYVSADTAERPWVKVGETIATSATSVTKSDDIYHNGDITIGGTVVNNAEYVIPDQTIFNIWDHKSDSENLPKFYFTGGEFPNPLPLTQPNNYVYNFGINISPGGGNLDDTKASLAVGFETEFYIDGLAHSEWHVLANDEDNIKQRRPISIATAHDGSYIGMSHHLSYWGMLDHNQTKEVWGLNLNTEELNYNGTGLKHIFNTVNYQPLWQNNGLASAPLIGYLTGRLQLANPTGDAIGRIGQGFEFGSISGTDFIGSALGDGVTNLHLGAAGRKYNTIFINGNFELPLRINTPSNSNGWGHGITSSGYYFYDYTSSKNVLELRADRVQANSPLNLGTSYPVDGTGVINGSMFKGTDGALYYKGGAGTVTLIAPN